MSSGYQHKPSSGGGAPSGTAGGELAGTYPNPTVTATHSGSTHLALATNAVLLGTSAAAGAAGTTLRSDDTIAAFDATAPVTQAFSDVAAVGTIAFAARRDHKHGMPASPSVPAAATTVTDETSYGVSKAVGTAETFAREDHTHGSGALGALGTTAAAGNDSRLSDARTPTAHASTHTTGADKIATGTPNGTLFLRDDFAWVAPTATAAVLVGPKNLVSTVEAIAANTYVHVGRQLEIASTGSIEIPATSTLEITA